MSFTNNTIPNTYLSRSAARKKGKILKEKNISPGEDRYSDAITAVQTWRNQCVPATERCFRAVMECAQEFEEAVATYRMKRVTSIVNKIQRPNSKFELTTLNDIGGCRLIVNTINDVEKAKKILEKQFEITTPEEIKDYIEEPPESGYRSCHLLTRHEVNNIKYRVEVQIRTKLQHYWATAIEVFDELYGTSLKSPNNTETDEKTRDELKEPLAFVSSLFALEEHTPMVSGTPRTEQQLLDKLSKSDRFKTAIDEMEEAFSSVLEIKVGSSENTSIFLLVFLKDEQVLFLKPYKQEELDKALKNYSKLEKEVEEKASRSTRNVVLVHAKDIEQLKLAYPNYSANAPEFVKKVREYLSAVQ